MLFSYGSRSSLPGRSQVQVVRDRRSACRHQNAFERCSAARRGGPRKARSLAVLLTSSLTRTWIGNSLPRTDPSSFATSASRRAARWPLCSKTPSRRRSRERLRELEAERPCTDDRDQAPQLGKQRFSNVAAAFHGGRQSQSKEGFSRRPQKIRRQLIALFPAQRLVQRSEVSGFKD